MSLAHSVAFLDIAALGLLDLRQEVLHRLLSLFAANLTNLFSVVFWHSDLHLRQVAILLVDGPAKDLLFSVHVIIPIEVDSLRAGRSILQVLFHAL